MQKKLIAIVVTLAMLLSTFGVIAPVFAAGVGPYTVSVDKDEVLTAKVTNVKVTVKDDGKANANQAYYGLYEDLDGEGGADPVRISTGSFKSGSVLVAINADVEYGVVYTIVVDDQPLAASPAGYPAAAKATVVTKHDMSVTIPSINYGETKTITGTVKDGSGDKIDIPPVVEIWKDGYDEVVAYSKASSSGSFAIGATFDDAGEYIVMLQGSDVEYTTFSVSPDEIDVEVDKTTIMTGKMQSVEITVEDDGDPVPNAVIVISGISVDADSVSVSAGDRFYGDVTNGKYTKLFIITDEDGIATVSAEYLKTGTAKVTAKWEDPDDLAETPDLDNLAPVAADYEAEYEAALEDLEDAEDAYDAAVAAEAAAQAAYDAAVAAGPGAIAAAQAAYDAAVIVTAAAQAAYDAAILATEAAQAAYDAAVLATEAAEEDLADAEAALDALNAEYAAMVAAFQLGSSDGGVTITAGEQALLDAKAADCAAAAADVVAAETALTAAEAAEVTALADLGTAEGDEADALEDLEDAEADEAAKLAILVAAQGGVPAALAALTAAQAAVDDAEDAVDAAEAAADAAWEAYQDALEGADEDLLDVLDGDEFDYVGETEYKIGTPDDLNISLSTDEVDPAELIDLEIEVWDEEGNGLVEEEDDDLPYGGMKEINVVIEGCGIDEDEDFDAESAHVEDGGVGDATVIDLGYLDMMAEMGGDITVTVTVTFWDDTEIVKTEKIEVDGWKIEVTPTLATFDKEYEFKVVVTKPDGTAINNAVVYLKDVDEEEDLDDDNADFDADKDDDGDWVAFESIDASSKNINNGIYKETVIFNVVGTATVLVTNSSGDIKAYAEIEVEGENVYDVTAPEKVVAGLREDIEITAKDEDGEYVEDSNAVIEIDGDEYEYDLDDEVYTVDFFTDETGEYEVIFKTDEGELIGKTTIEVVAPKLVLPYDDGKLTYNVEETWEAKIVDPRDDSVIEDVVLYVSADNCLFDIDGDDDDEIVMPNGKKEFDILAYEQDDDDDPMTLTFEVSIDGEDVVEVAEIEVVPMVITASPAEISVDVASTVTITVVDAHGKPYAGKDVFLSGLFIAESETDEAGKVTFKLKPNTTGKIAIEVETDAEDEDGDDVFAEGEIKVVIKAAGAGVITMQLGNTTAVANGVMGTLDVAPFAENGRTLVPFRYIGEALGAYVEFIAPNKILYRLRKDANTVDEVWLTIGSTTASVNGVDVTLEVAPKIVNGRTVVPLRFIGEAFGFYVDYNFGTQTITLTK